MTKIKFCQKQLYVQIPTEELLKKKEKRERRRKPVTTRPIMLFDIVHMDHTWTTGPACKSARTIVRTTRWDRGSSFWCGRLFFTVFCRTIRWTTFWNWTATKVCSGTVDDTSSSITCSGLYTVTKLNFSYDHSRSDGRERN